MPNIRYITDRSGKNECTFNNQNSDFNAEPTFGQTYGTGFGPNVRTESPFGASLVETTQFLRNQTPIL